MNAEISTDGVTYRVALSDEQDHIQRHLLKGSPYEATMLRHMAKYDGLLVDAGANIGNHSLYWAALGRPVVAFEPDPVLAGCIRLSAEMNGFGHLAVVEEGLGSERTTARLTGHPDGNVGAQGLRVGVGTIPVFPLDDWKLNPAVLKIDVEGMELKVLHGARETIALSRPVIYIESFQDNYAQMADWMAEHGYQRRARFGNRNTYCFTPEA